MPYSSTKVYDSKILIYSPFDRTGTMRYYVSGALSDDAPAFNTVAQYV